MTLKREALRTHAVVGRRAVAVRQELPEMSAADRTFDFVSNVKRTNQHAEQIAEFYQRLAREYLGYQCD